ncbi:hypothetical protein LAWI1_G002258 [Lachnellula willkommii]|uniref:Uncharacterized protein n=1 Tax=Lachnellula willkommii TaxID=215461 RepID=A0A559MGX7_9HELO|nr:hypothetical protein LAWI1_G002258 [Lachnellula willkommii]
MTEIQVKSTSSSSKADCSIQTLAPQPQPQSESQPDIQPNPQPESQSNIQPEPQSKPQPDIQPDVQPDIQPDIQPELPPEPQIQVPAQDPADNQANNAIEADVSTLGLCDGSLAQTYGNQRTTMHSKETPRLANCKLKDFSHGGYNQVSNGRRYHAYRDGKYLLVAEVPPSEQHELT